MKVYKCIKDYFLQGGGMALNYKKDWFFCEETTERGTNYINPSYPLDKKHVEDNYEYFMYFYTDNENTSDFYIRPIYTEYQMQEKLNP